MSRKFRRNQAKSFKERSAEIEKVARANESATVYAVAEKVGSRWVWAYKGGEACRDTVFAIMQHGPNPVRRVDL